MYTRVADLKIVSVFTPVFKGLDLVWSSKAFFTRSGLGLGRLEIFDSDQ